MKWDGEVDMTGIREFLGRLFSTIRNRKNDRETDEELKFHLEMETEAAMRRGLSRKQAERTARLRAGEALSAREAVRDQRGLPWFDDLLSDLRISARGLFRQRSFAAVTITALALAVAINTVIFALVDGVLLQPLPYHEPQQLIRVFESGERYPKFPVSIAQFYEFAESSRTLDRIALYVGGDLQMMHQDRAENITAVRVSHEFFPILGIQPILGRNFEESETQGDARVVILSHSLWTNRFDQDPQIVGRKLRLNRENWTVIGVLPPGFEHIGGTYRSPLQGETVGIWWPVRLDAQGNGRYNSHYMNAIARLKPGITVAQAQEDLDRLVRVVENRYTDTHRGWRALVSPLVEEVVGSSRETVLLLIAAGTLVLLIACANIAGLCVARGLARRREVAIRCALGARAGRLVRGLIAENLLLGLAGGIAGLALAAGAIPLMKMILPSGFPRLHAIHLSPFVGAFALVSAVVTAVVAGLLPAMRQTRMDPRDALQDEPRGASAGRSARRLRASLVTAEIALAALLCAATLLLARSAHLLSERNHGFDGTHVLTFNLALPGAAYPKLEVSSRFYAELTRRLQQIPGVESAGVTTNLPWTGYDDNSGFDIVGRGDEQQADGQGGRYQAASPGYFGALKIPLVAGRIFTDADDREAPPVMLINDSLRSRYFPNENPIGKFLDTWGKKWEIVGVIADIRDRPGDLDAEPGFWFPMVQMPFGMVSVAVRTSGDPLPAAAAIANELKAIDAELPMSEIRTMETIMSAALAERRFALWLFEAFAVLALTLAAVGIYGLLAYLVEQRRKELGIRMALGASRWMIVKMVLSDGARLGVVGVVVGLLVTPLAGRALVSFLYGVGAADPMSLISAAIAILTVALLASLVPAWLASQAAPMSALREE